MHRVIRQRCGGVCILCLLWYHCACKGRCFVQKGLTSPGKPNLELQLVVSEPNYELHLVVVYAVG